MPPVTVGYLFPDPIDPGEFACFKVYVPKHVLYLAAFWSSYEYLAQWSAWRRDAEHTARDVAAIWRTAYEMSRSEMGEDCDMPQFRIDPETCLLEVNCGTTEEPDWNPVITSEFNPPIDTPTPTSLYPEPDEDTQCLAAMNTTAMLKNGVDQFSGLIELTGPLGDVIALLYSTLIQFINVVQSQLWLGLTVQYGNLDPETIVADALEFDWDTFTCRLMMAYESDGTMTALAHITLLDEMQDNFADSQIWRVLYMIWSLMGAAGATLSTRWAGITEADCELCVWEHEFDFTTGEHGWTIEPYSDSSAEYQAGIGFRLVENHGAAGVSAFTVINRTFDARVITEVDVVGYDDTGTIIIFTAAVCAPTPDDVLDQDTVNNPGLEVRITFNLELPGSTPRDELFIRLQTGAVDGSSFPPGFHVLEKVVMRGLLTDPF